MLRYISFPHFHHPFARHFSVRSTIYPGRERWREMLHWPKLLWIGKCTMVKLQPGTRHQSSVRFQQLGWLLPGCVIKGKALLEGNLGHDNGCCQWPLVTHMHPACGRIHAAAACDNGKQCRAWNDTFSMQIMCVVHNYRLTYTIYPARRLTAASVWCRPDSSVLMHWPDGRLQ